MIHNTRGIVLRTVKYGETSIVAGIFTERFGMQSYLVQGIRTQGRASAKAGLLQPGSILEMEVYHNELKNLQRIKEFRWAHLYKNILSDVTRNSVAIYMVELLQKCLKEPEPNAPLFQFTEEAFLHLDTAGDTVTANFPAFFSLKLVHFLGFRIRNNFSKENAVLDLREGLFLPDVPSHAYFVKEDYGYYVSQLLHTRQYADLSLIKLNNVARKEILAAILVFYALHIQEFGAMRSLPVLHEIMA